MTTVGGPCVRCEKMISDWDLQVGEAHCRRVSSVVIYIHKTCLWEWIDAMVRTLSVSFKEGLR